MSFHALSERVRINSYLDSRVTSSLAASRQIVGNAARVCGALIAMKCRLSGLKEMFGLWAMTIPSCQVFLLMDGRVVARGV